MLKRIRRLLKVFAVFRRPLRDLPPNYVETEYLDVTDPKRLLWLNLMSFVPLAVSAVLVMEWWLWSVPRRAGLGDAALPWWAVVGGLLLLLVAHEAIHGVAMWLLGHRPTFGVKLSEGLLYTLAEGAYYRRNEFMVITLAPLVVMSVAGLALMLVTPNNAAFWLGVAVVVNAGSAVGDLWMAARAMRYPASALIRDEPTGVRFYMRADA
jgi:hypothetical protein